jgi:hypothetical protein
MTQQDFSARSIVGVDQLSNKGDGPWVQGVEWHCGTLVRISNASCNYAWSKARRAVRLNGLRSDRFFFSLKPCYAHLD